MTTVRLRRRLSFSHALLALVLVSVAATGLYLSSRRAANREAVLDVGRDTQAIAALASLEQQDRRLLVDLTQAEASGLRRAEFVDESLHELAGQDLTGTPAVRSLAEQAIATRTTKTRLSDRYAISASPIIAADGKVVAAIVLEEPLTSTDFGMTGWAVTVPLCLGFIIAAALAGRALARRIVTPIEQLTDQARQLALGEGQPIETSSTMPEVATLSASLSRVAERLARLTLIDYNRKTVARASMRRLSHRLRTPLTVMRLRLEILLDPSLGQDERDRIGPVFERQIAMLEELSTDLNSVDIFDDDVAHDLIDLRALVTQVINRYAPLASWGHVDLTVHESTHTVTVVCDGYLLAEALCQVVENAIKYSPRGRNVQIEYVSDLSWVVLSVDDQGPGFRGEHELIRQPGVRGSASKQAPGTGQGLAVAGEAMERLGGRLELSDNADGGATVRLVIPVVAGCSPAPGGAAPSGAEGVGADFRLGP